MEKSGSSQVNVMKATSVGKVASNSLMEARKGSVFGRTSQGIFIKLIGRWLLFLSIERFRGPLTINLRHEESTLADLEVGMEVELSPTNLLFPETGWHLSLNEAEIWQPRAAGSTTTRAETEARMVKLAGKVMEESSESGLAPLLPQLLKMIAQSEVTSDKQPILQAQILQLHQQIKTTGNLPPSSRLIGLLGSGSGLTPSGDDFVLGIILALNRYPDLFPVQSGSGQSYRQVVEAAYHKTTTLSANLIECASLGLGNERLIDTLDWLVSSDAGETPPVDNFLSWGNSSGIDVFVGFVVALSI